MKTSVSEKLILTALNNKNKLTVHEASEMLNISQATVRRLFAKMENAGKLIRIHGGVRVPEGFWSGTLSRDRAEHKIKIGEHAAKTVKSGDVIYLGGGSTVNCMVSVLKQRLADSEISDVTVFTNSFPCLIKLHGYCQIQLVGGIYREQTGDFGGYLTERTLRQIRFNKGYLGADGIDKEFVMADDAEAARIGEIVTLHSERVFLLADSSKFFKKSFITYASIESPYEYITDTEATLEVMSYFTGKGINITSV